VLKFGTPIRKVSTQSAIAGSDQRTGSPTSTIAACTQDKCFFLEDNGALHIVYRNATNMLVIVQANIGTVDIDDRACDHLQLLADCLLKTTTSTCGSGSFRRSTTSRRASTCCSPIAVHAQRCLTLATS
jgi:hypothetical protein